MSYIIEKTQKYFMSTSQYPLLVVVPSEEYKAVLLAFLTIPKIKVSDYCIGDDKEPDTEKLHEDIKRVNGNFILVGLGDYLANKSSIAKKTLLLYKDLILQNNSHVVILLSPHMYQILKEVYESDPRVRIRIVLPKIAPKVNMINSNVIAYGIKAYLKACEKGDSVGSVKSARDIKLVHVINIESAFDELKHRFPNEFKNLSKNAGSVNNWGNLLENINKSKKNIREYLAAQNFEALEYIFLDYAKKNDYMSWLYFLNLKLNSNKQSYIGRVASKANTLSELFCIAKTEILNISVSDEYWSQYYNQRKTMLKGCTDVDMADFVSKIAICGDDRIAYLTDNTKIEKQASIVSLCEGAKDDYLSVSYPDLYLYLQDFSFEDKRFTKYFSNYKKCKIQNRIDENFLTVVAEFAINRPYNLLPARSSLISSFDDGNTLLIFLDALGVEYLGYIKGKCSELNMHFNSKIVRADLPTNTSINRVFFDEWHGKKETRVKDLDDLKHHPEKGYYNNSTYPIHLPEELDIIKTVLERAKVKLSTSECQRVVIASDHGASRLAVISPDIQINNNGCCAKSCGRYCTGDNLPNSSNIVTESDRGYAVISDYTRFANSRKASVETHGGATLEEVIVPIIEITLLDNNIKVYLDNNIVEVSYKVKTPTLIILIIPDYEDITAAINDEECLVEKLEKNKFKVILPQLKKGKYKLDIFESQNKIASKFFTVKSKGFTERDIF